MTAITTAARLLRVAANELKNAHTLGGDWGNELEALDAYNEHMATATTLEHMGRQCLAQIEEPAQPVCWIRFCSDGSTEGPIMHSQICEARKTSGAWTPLYAGAAPAAVSQRGEYPQLPEGVMFIEQIGGDVIGRPTDYGFKHGRGIVHGAELFTSEQLRAYFDLGRQPSTAAPALEAPPAVAPQGEYPHEQMDAMALARYKVVPSHASMLWSHAVVAGDGAQQLYVGREVECQNMARKFAGAFLDGAFAFHSMAAAPTAQAAPALEAPAAPADGATPGPWFVRKREVNGELRDCFVAAPDCQGLAYDACILCDDEYHDGVGRKLADCELIVAAVNQHRAALAAAPQAPAVPVAVTTRAELEKLQGGAGSMATIFPADASGFPVRLYAEPAAPAVDAALNALIADVRALPTLRASEIDGEESDGTPKHWRNRPFVSLRKLELLLRDRVTASSDTALLNFIAAEYLDLRSFGMPTGQGDADVGWRVIQHHMGEPTERVVAEVYKDDPRSAIRAAIARLERDPYCTGALHEEDAAQAREGGAA
ncbi:hypothetical protein [Delftia tsuruhatensis]|uniref:hypothetical protein n=2 Tax=Delftia TaxID=80865 RepID=UPI0023DCDDE7|nr:hypothetical protein [Delftia tsuruhatensis]WEL97012.1 hypothetical protein PW274_23490 [Delftia tsuruhatensis]